MSILDRIQDYLGNGGLFNPELMEHDKVRTLIIDARGEIFRLQNEEDKARLDWLQTRYAGGDSIGLPFAVIRRHDDVRAAIDTARGISDEIQPGERGRADDSLGEPREPGACW